FHAVSYARYSRVSAISCVFLLLAFCCFVLFFFLFCFFLSYIFFFFFFFFFFKQKTAYEIGLGIPAEPLFRSISWFSLLLLQLLRHLFYRHLKLHRQRYILIV